MSSNIRIQRICERCGGEFTARTTVTRYCGEHCSKRAYKERQRGEKITSSNIETAKVLSTDLAQIQTKDFLSITESAKLLGMSRWTIARAIKDGRLKTTKFGRRIVIKRQEIDKLFS